MGRPRQFDEGEALDRAVDLFWSQGYEATSTAELAKVMGLGNQSLYNSFGDKHALFLSAWDRYQAKVVDPLLAQMEGPEASAASIRAYFRTLVRTLSSPIGRRACLIVNSTMELALHDPEVAVRCREHGERLERAFTLALRREPRGGGPSPKALARHLTALATGLGVMAKAGATRRALGQAAAVGLMMLPGHRATRKARR